MLGNLVAPIPGFTLAPDVGGGATLDAPPPRAIADTGGGRDNREGTGTGGTPSVGRDEAPSAAPTRGAVKMPSDASSPPLAPTSEPTPKTFPDNWRHDMAAGDKAFLKTLDRFDSPAALAKAYRELTAKLSSGELRAAKPPGVDASPEHIAAWRAGHGLPESAAAYMTGLTLPGGMVPGLAEEPLIASFAEQAMKGNWTGEQYNQAVGWYFDAQDRLMAQRQLADAQFKEQASSDLMREWGTDYAVNRNAVVQFLDRQFPQELKIELLNARLSNGSLLANLPGFNKAILEVAKIVSPSGAVLPNASGAGLSSVESRIAEIEGKYMRATNGSEPWKTYWTGAAGAHMQQEYRGLLAAREQARRGQNA